MSRMYQQLKCDKSGHFEQGTGRGEHEEYHDALEDEYCLRIDWTDSVWERRREWVRGQQEAPEIIT